MSDGSPGRRQKGCGSLEFEESMAAEVEWLWIALGTKEWAVTMVNKKERITFHANMIVTLGYLWSNDCAVWCRKKIRNLKDRSIENEATRDARWEEMRQYQRTPAKSTRHRVEIIPGVACLRTISQELGTGTAIVSGNGKQRRGFASSRRVREIPSRTL